MNTRRIVLWGITTGFTYFTLAALFSETPGQYNHVVGLGIWRSVMALKNGGNGTLNSLANTIDVWSFKAFGDSAWEMASKTCLLLPDSEYSEFSLEDYTQLRTNENPTISEAQSIIGQTFCPTTDSEYRFIPSYQTNRALDIQFNENSGAIESYTWVNTTSESTTQSIPVESKPTSERIGDTGVNGLLSEDRPISD